MRRAICPLSARQVLRTLCFFVFMLCACAAHADSYPSPATLTIYIDAHPRRIDIWLSISGPALEALEDVRTPPPPIASALREMFGTDVKFVKCAVADQDPSGPREADWFVEAEVNEPNSAMQAKGGLISGTIALTPLHRALHSLRKLNIDKLQVNLQEDVHGAPVALCAGASPNETPQYSVLGNERVLKAWFTRDIDVKSPNADPPLQWMMGYAPSDIAGSIALYSLFVALPIAALTLLRDRALRAQEQAEASRNDVTNGTLWYADRLSVIWFGYLMTVNRALLGLWGVWLIVNLIFWPAGAFIWCRGGAEAQTTLLLVSFLLPLLLVQLAAAILARPLYQRIRGVHLTLGDVLLQIGGVVILQCARVAFIALAYTALLESNFTRMSGNHPQAALLSLLRNAYFLHAVGWFALTALSPVLIGTVLILGRGPRRAAFPAGALRDRVEELAKAANVRVREAYWQTTGRDRQANAFAQAGAIILTERLLATLSRQEVDAVIAHELAHLKLRHLLKRQALAFFSGILLGLPIVAAVIASREPDDIDVVTTFWIRLALVVGVPLITGAIVLSQRWLSRRHEREADLFAVRLTGQPAALITGLARLQRLAGLPRDWDRRDVRLLTHPSTQHRIRALTAEGALSDDQLAELIAESDSLDASTEAATDDGYPLPEETGHDQHVFAPGLLQSYLMRLAWASMFSGAVVGLLFGAVGVAATPKYPLLSGLIFLAGPFAASFMARLARDRRAVAPYVRAQAKLRQRLDIERHLAAAPPGTEAVYVGLSPGKYPRSYGGWLDWDAGFLLLEPEHLRYIGEKADFDLRRDAIEAIESARAWPGQPPNRVVVAWRGGENEGSVNLRPATPRSLTELGRAGGDLREKLRRWRERPAVSAQDRIAEPVPSLLAPTGGLTPAAAFKPAVLRTSATIQLWLLLALGCLSGLSLSITLYAFLVGIVLLARDAIRYRRYRDA